MGEWDWRGTPMLEVINGLPDNVVAITVTGRVTNEECDNVLRPAMERSLRRHNKIRLYYEVGSRFPGAGWDDLDIAIDHLPQWERIAVVTDTAWVRHTVNALRFLIASEVRVFTMVDAAEGRAWITARLGAEAGGPRDVALTKAPSLKPPGEVHRLQSKQRLSRPLRRGSRSSRPKEPLADSHL
jgi:hypothetical protein